jgi:hypothetical protein
MTKVVTMDVVDDEGDPGGLKSNTRSMAPPPANMPSGRAAAGTTLEGRA